MADEYGHFPRGPRKLWSALTWSVQGLRAAWLHESSFRLEVVIAIVAIPAALALGANGIERALLISSVLLVLALELLNSAIEAVIERYGPEQHELAGRAKDMGSAAVFIGLIAGVLTWLLILVGS
ncbi:diacylglycerol kinase [Xanthomonas phaseoli pv. syngonii LMG 9055]|uniref:Diacylglycerol kinase n=1 Tax=Xanthomonas phaseoli pv. syngonii LMG 9055 TaxID=1437878 RepID=A0A1V9HDE6_9XANT|nr:diacylglycerol kinase [Xanthomonas phaseoli pv. syngonii LMG 9055]